MMLVLSFFYYDKTKTFSRVFDDIENLYVTLYWSSESEHIDVWEQVVVWSSIKL